MVVEFAKIGLGIGYVTKDYVKNELMYQELYEIKLKQKFDQLEFALIYTNEYQKNHVKEFVRIAKKYKL